MPKNTVSNPITDQEMAFAHLVLSGTMTDRRAAEAVGLNPATAAYTKARPPVRAYMAAHRAAVSEKLVSQEAEGLRSLNPGRSQILARLWELANLNPEATRGSMAGQVKALAMIVAIEGLIPDRRLSPPATPPTPAPVEKPQNYVSEWLRKQKQQSAEDLESGQSAVEDQSQPGASHAPEPPSSQPDDSCPGIVQAAVRPESVSWVPEATAGAYDTLPDDGSARRHPFAPSNRFSGRRR